MKLVLASGNAGKLAEIRTVLDGSGFADLNVELVAQSALGIADAEETASTFVENALIKARHATRASGMPALGDDSGICVDALNGAPGLLSARYAGTHADKSGGNAQANIVKLLDAMRDVPDVRRTAHFHCTLVLLRHAGDPAPLIAEGRWHGTILHAPRGKSGFGYDPVFLPDDGGGLSAAELDAVTKNRSSHRGLALARLRELLHA